MTVHSTYGLSRCESGIWCFVQSAEKTKETVFLDELLMQLKNSFWLIFSHALYTQILNIPAYTTYNIVTDYIGYHKVNITGEWAWIWTKSNLFKSFRRNISREVIGYVYKRIFSGEYEVGDRLPT